MGKGDRRILLLCADAARHIGTVEEHLQAFKKFSRNQVLLIDALAASRLRLDLSMFDAIVFHYSIVISLQAYLPDGFADQLAAFPGPKILFIQDEFRWVNRTMATAEKLGISVIFTVVNADLVRKIYRNPYFDRVRFEQTLTGFVPEHLIERKVPNYVDRPLDVSYRARKLPGWCGSFALQKWQIGERFLADAPKHGLKCDIAMSEASRIYGERWIDFVASSKATLGTESGASFVDYTGEVHEVIDTFEAANPDAQFEVVRERFLEGRDGEVVIHVISPRCFEAACLRTLMILYPGEYSGVLQAGRHYVPLAPDHSNMEEVVLILRNPELASEIIHNAYEEVAKAPVWTFRAFISHFDCVVDEVVPRRTAASLSFHTIEQSVADAQKRIAEDAQRQAEDARRQAAADAQRAETERLESERRKLTASTGPKMRLVIWAQGAKNVVARLVRSCLPQWAARPLLALGRSVDRPVKLILKRVLRGRNEAVSLDQRHQDHPQRVRSL